MFKKAITLILVILTLFMVTGCQANEYERRTDESNTLYVGSVGASFPTSFMPWLSRSGVAPTIASMLYNTLFSYDDQTGEFLELIGKEWYYVDKDGNPILTNDGKIDYDRLEDIYGSDDDYLVVKVTIHDDVYWHDGERLTVEDIYYTFDIGCNNELSNHAGALAWTADLQHSYSNGILTNQGMFTYENGANDRGYTISESEKDTVMYLHVNKVLGAITSLFSTILILPEHIWEPIVTPENQLNSKDPSAETLEQYQNPVGSGPYRLDGLNSNAQVITLYRYDDYHLKDNQSDYLFKVENIKFMLFQEQNVAIYALLKGHIDVLDATVSSNYLSLFENRDDIFVSNAKGIFTQTLVINLNPATSERNALRDLLGIKDFRRAIALAINQEELVEYVLNGAGETVSAGLLRESLEDFYNNEADILRYDLETRINEANAILDEIVPQKDESGYRLLDGERISYTILGTPGEQEVISRLQVQLQRIGIEVEYKAKGSSSEKTFLFNSKFDMTLHGVIFSLSNADIMYRAHFANLSQSSNYGRLNDTELNSKINEMRMTLNLNRKYELLQELQVLIAEEYYKIPLYTSNIISVARTDRYSGYVVVEGSTIFNTDSLQNLERVEG